MHFGLDNRKRHRERLELFVRLLYSHQTVKMVGDIEDKVPALVCLLILCLIDRDRNH